MKFSLNYKYIPIEEPSSPAWLTAVLRGSGALGNGRVTAVESRPSAAFNSQTGFLHVTYSPDAPVEAPTRLVLKRSTPEAWSVQAGIHEARFYQLAASLQGGSPEHPPVLPPCYAAAYDPGGGDSYLLLADLSESHAPPVSRADLIGLKRAVPRPAHQEAVIDTLAGFHVFWWAHPQMGSDDFEVGYWTRTSARFDAYLAKRRAAWARLLAQDGEHISPDVRTFYENLLDGLPHFWQNHLSERFEKRQNLTLIHGDAYFSNFLCPRRPGASPTILLDWQSPSFDMGAYDLANLLATFWTRQVRQEGGRERRLLERYHARLLEGGVRGYTWEDLGRDYRIGLVFWVLMPVQDAADGSSRGYWQPKMRCLLAAFNDWDCNELLL